MNAEIAITRVRKNENYLDSKINLKSQSMFLPLVHHQDRPHHLKPDPIIFMAVPGPAQPIIVSSGAALKTMNAASSQRSTRDSDFQG